MADDPRFIEIRAGDTKVYTDVATDTVSGDPITADLLADGWVATCQIRVNYDPTSTVLAEFDCQITDAQTIRRTLFEDQSLLLDGAEFAAEDVAKVGKRKVYWDAQLRLPDGLAVGEDYVVTYLSGTITILGQVSRSAV